MSKNLSELFRYELGEEVYVVTRHEQTLKVSFKKEKVMNRRIVSTGVEQYIVNEHWLQHWTESGEYYQQICKDGEQHTVARKHYENLKRHLEENMKGLLSDMEKNEGA